MGLTAQKMIASRCATSLISQAGIFDRIVQEERYEKFIITKFCFLRDRV